MKWTDCLEVYCRWRWHKTLLNKIPFKELKVSRDVHTFAIQASQEVLQLIQFLVWFHVWSGLNFYKSNILISLRVTKKLSLSNKKNVGFIKNFGTESAFQSHPLVVCWQQTSCSWVWWRLVTGWDWWQRRRLPDLQTRGQDRTKYLTLWRDRGS